MWQVEPLIYLQEQETYIKTYVYRSNCIPVAKTHLTHTSSFLAPKNQAPWRNGRFEDWGRKSPPCGGNVKGILGPNEKAPNGQSWNNLSNKIK